MKKLAKIFLYSILILFIFSSILGVFLNRPVFVSYASSGSMVPAIKEGDIFFINPLPGSPEVGDIVVFEMNGKWTVHRVVGELSSGYITKGDANVATDQMKGNSPIVRENIAGKVVVFGENPVLIPSAGKILEKNLSGEIKIIFAIILMLSGIVSFIGRKNERKKGKRVIKLKFSTLYVLLSVILLTVFMITTFLSWEIHSVDYAVTSAGGVREGWYLPGSSFESSITIRNSNIFPLMFYLKEGTENVEIVDKVDERFLLNPGESREVTLQINSPEDTSLYREKIIVNSYIPLLPEQVISEVYQYNPVYPLFLMIGEIVVLLFVLQKVSGTGNVVAVRVRIKRTGLWRFKL